MSFKRIISITLLSPFILAGLLIFSPYFVLYAIVETLKWATAGALGEEYTWGEE